MRFNRRAAIGDNGEVRVDAKRRDLSRVATFGQHPQGCAASGHIYRAVSKGKPSYMVWVLLRQISLPFAASGHTRKEKL